MIAWLRGRLRSKTPEAVVLDVGGVGYQVQLSLNSFCQLPAVGEVAAVDVFTHVREDQITLFGFIVSGEKEAFRHLISISGIGPRLALNILSGIAPSELTEAVARADLRRLKAVPGVGKRTAERMLVELKDKLGSFSLSAESAVSALPGEASASVRNDLILALTSLGYKRAEIDRVLRTLPLTPDSHVEDVIKKALRLLQS